MIKTQANGRRGEGAIAASYPEANLEDEDDDEYEYDKPLLPDFGLVEGRGVE
jgi:hypothetical protein